MRRDERGAVHPLPRRPGGPYREYTLTLAITPPPSPSTISLTTRHAPLNLHPRQAQRKLVFCLSEEEGGALFTLPLGRGIAGLCAATNRAVNIADCANDARFDGSTDKAPGCTANPNPEPLTLTPTPTLALALTLALTLTRPRGAPRVRCSPYPSRHATVAPAFLSRGRYAAYPLHVHIPCMCDVHVHIPCMCIYPACAYCACACDM